MEIDGQIFPEMQCTCGAGVCIIRTSRTERNPGRKFYSCPGMQGKGCDFFKWCDTASPLKKVVLESESAELGDSRNNPVNHQSPQMGQKDTCFNCKKIGHWARDCPEKAKSSKELPAVRSFDGQYLPEMVCRCGAGTCLLLTAKTQKNPGRKFYKCPGKDGENCHFFEWCDNGKIDQNCDVPQSPHPVCSCRAGICRIEIVKDGKEVGQKVFVCPVKKGEGACNFYQLLDSSGKTASSICLEGTNVFSLSSVSNAQEDNDAIKELIGSKLEGMLPSGSPKEPLSEECDTTVETGGLGSGVLNAYFLPVENLTLNKCSSAESDAKHEEGTQSGIVKHGRKDCTGSPGTSLFKWVKRFCMVRVGPSVVDKPQSDVVQVLEEENLVEPVEGILEAEPQSDHCPSCSCGRGPC